MCAVEQTRHASALTIRWAAAGAAPVPGYHPDEELSGGLRRRCRRGAGRLHSPAETAWQASHATAVALRDLPNQRQPEAHASFALCLSRQPEESFEAAFAEGCGHAGAVVNAQLDRRLRVGRSPDFGLDLVAGIAARVMRQLAGGAARQPSISQRLRCRFRSCRAFPGCRTAALLCRSRTVATVCVLSAAQGIWGTVAYRVRSWGSPDLLPVAGRPGA